jgi:hypothetical protein
MSEPLSVEMVRSLMGETAADALMRERMGWLREVALANTQIKELEAQLAEARAAAVKWSYDLEGAPKGEWVIAATRSTLRGHEPGTLAIAVSHHKPQWWYGWGDLFAWAALPAPPLAPEEREP